MTTSVAVAAGARRPTLELMKIRSRRAVVRVIQLGGISRHGVIASARWVRHAAPKPSRAIRVAWVIPSAALIGLGVALILAAELGVPPYDVLLSAIAERTALTHGQASWAISVVLMSTATLLGVRPKLVGLVYVFTVGLAIDVGRQVIADPDALQLRIGMAALGLALLASGIAIIVHTQATGGAMELLMQAGARRGLRPVRVRTALEFSIFGIGLALGGAFGPVTVITAVVLGPSIAAALQALADHRAGRDLRLGREAEPA